MTSRTRRFLFLLSCCLLSAPALAQTVGARGGDATSLSANDLAGLTDAYLKASNTESVDFFGGAISVSGDTVAIGASGEDSGAKGVNGDQGDNSVNFAGAVYVFVRGALGWEQQAYLKASNTQESVQGGGSSFGLSVSLSGDTLIVGAWEEASNGIGVNGSQFGNQKVYTGAAYIFVRTGTTWTQQAYLKASDATVGDFFGVSVAVSGDTAVVGARRDPSLPIGDVADGGHPTNSAAVVPGVAYVFVRNGTQWSEQAILTASNFDPGDFYGSPVAIDDDTILVGAIREASLATGVNGDETNNSALFAGAVYVYERTGTSWNQTAYLKASNTNGGDAFGSQLLVSGDTVVIGSPGEASRATGVNGDQANNDLPSAGAVYVFERSGMAWSQQAYLKASNTEAGDYFGGAIAMSGETLIVGAVLEDSRATGSNGDQSDNSAQDSGAAYVFARHAGSWVQESYLKAPNSDPFDNYGSALALDGNLAVVGSLFEASSATGVNGDQGDNSLLAPGAAFVHGLPTLVADGSSVSLTSGGQHRLALRAGTERANWFYWIFGSATGTSPGIDINGSLNLPLNVDGYFGVTLNSPGYSSFTGYRGMLDELGNGSASLSIPAGSDLTLAGLELNHAFVAAEVYGDIEYASQAIALTLVN